MAGAGPQAPPAPAPAPAPDGAPDALLAGPPLGLGDCAGRPAVLRVEQEEQRAAWVDEATAQRLQRLAEAGVPLQVVDAAALLSVAERTTTTTRLDC
jgi:hypothetical protein